MRTRSLLTLAATAIVAVSLSACATGQPGASTASPTPDEFVTAPISAAWLDGGRYIGLVTEGSSTCVPDAEDATLDADGTLAVVLAELDPDVPCTADFAPRVSLVAVPEGVDPAADLEISVTGAGVKGGTSLRGVEGLVPAGEDPTPSAGWTDLDGVFVLLLWGSSTCEEYVTATEVSGAASVTASLSGIPADKVCTADLAPNPVVVFADGLQSVEDVELTLTGAVMGDVTLPIAGVNSPA